MSKSEDKSSWAIGGAVIIGVGVGLIFVQTSPLLMVASIMIAFNQSLKVLKVLLTV